MSDRYHKASNGDPEAMFEIAEEFQRRRFHEEAKSWYLKASELGHIESSFRIGDLLYHQGQISEAIPHLSVAHSKGHNEATLVLGMAEREVGNFKKSEELLLDAKEKGMGRAIHELGILYFKLGDIDKAIYWIELSAESGNNVSMDVLPQLYLKKKDRKMAEKYFLKFIERGHASSAVAYGLLLQEEGDALAQEYLSKAVKLGHPMGEVILANYYFLQDNYEKSEVLFRNALEKSRSIEGTLGLGVLLCELERPEEGIKYLKEAAEYGSVEALYNLGVTYYNLGNTIESEEWLMKAIDAGDSDAENFYAKNFNKNPPK